MKTARLFSALCAVSFAVLSLPFQAVGAGSDSISVNTGAHELIIDSKTINKNKNSEWQGFGMVSSNGSSRLLLDYKYNDPDEYRRILELLFSPEGAVRMSHFRIELGSDQYFSGGTEPASKRSADEAANVRRGAGFQIAADIMEINPDVSFELFAWGVPAYISKADVSEQNELKYKWINEIIGEAYEEYGIKIATVSPNLSESSVDKEFIKYFAKKLRSEKDTPYDYGKIKITAADEDADFQTAALMLSDKEFMDAVDVIGIHYTSSADENTKKCCETFGKQLWYTEGIAPANVASLAVNADGSGLGGVNSTLDTAGRIVNMYANGGFTLYEFQPAVSAYYDGAAYYPKQLITANEPWSSYTDIGSGLYMCEHFSLFSDVGWQFVDSGCFGDGREEAHILLDTTDNYMTLTDPDTGDYSTVIVNNSDSARDYSFNVRGLAKADKAVQVWETRGPDEGEPFDARYMKNVMEIQPESVSGGSTYQLTVKPYSMVTVTTLDVDVPALEESKENTRLELPYTDDIEYSETGISALRYACDVSGVFEVFDDREKGMTLRQVITKDFLGENADTAPEPVTTFGDDTWSNYQVNANVRIGEADADIESYAGVGLRYINSSENDAHSGYRLILTAAGEWQLCSPDRIMQSGYIEGFDPNAWHALSITAAGDNLVATIDGAHAATVKPEKEVIFSGRAALYSSYTNSCFDDIEVLPVEQLTGYVNRLDDLDSNVRYSGDWSHNTMDSYTFHNRTSSRCEGGSCGFELNFEGDSFALIGTAENAVADIVIDGASAAENVTLSGDLSRAALWHRYSLGYGEHTVKVTVKSGVLTLDSLEYGSMTRLKNGDTEGGIIGEDDSISSGSVKQDSEDKHSELVFACGMFTAFVAGELVMRNILRKRDMQ